MINTWIRSKIELGSTIHDETFVKSIFPELLSLAISAKHWYLGTGSDGFVGGGKFPADSALLWRSISILSLSLDSPSSIK
eukprot:9419423-Pyramimonas_sp.AAC.1